MASIPRPTAPIADMVGGRILVNREWFDYFRLRAESGDLAEINEELAELRKQIDDIDTSSSGSIEGTQNIRVSGQLSDGVVVIDLEALEDTGGGTLQKTLRDDYGRLAGTSDATTTDLAEGNNLYYTHERADARAAAAVAAHVAAADPHPQYTTASEAAAAAPVQSVNGQTGSPTLVASDVGAQPASANLTAWAGIAPATKADDSAAVHKAGTETITGSKTFTDVVRVQIGTPAPGMIVGADVFGTGITPNVRKLFRMALQPYNASTASPLLIMSADTDGSAATTYVSIGGQGGASGVSAANEIRFVTGANYGDIGGILRWTVSNTGNFSPFSDNAYDVGGAANRPKQLWAATGTINTSDAREKTPVRQLAVAEIAAAIELGGEIGVYQWLAMVEVKGEAARDHIGLTVQCAIEVMQSHGLDPFAYGFICYDKWDELPEICNKWGALPQVVDDFGNIAQEARDAGFEIVQAYRPAGDRYSFRMDELLAFTARGIAHRLDAMEQRLAAAGL